MSAQDYLFSLVYHVLVHKKRIAPDYPPRICALAKSLHFPCYSSRADLAAFLWDKWMLGHEYTFIRPLDKNVPFNRPKLPTIQRLLDMR